MEYSIRQDQYQQYLRLYLNKHFRSNITVFDKNHKKNDVLSELRVNCADIIELHSENENTCIAISIRRMWIAFVSGSRGKVLIWNPRHLSTFSAPQHFLSTSAPSQHLRVLKVVRCSSELRTIFLSYSTSQH